MALLILWVSLALVVSIAAGSRGRSATAWLLISVIFSPLIGLILVLVMPNLKQERLLERLAVEQQVRNTERRTGWGRKITTVQMRQPGAFEPDGVYAGIPYRVAKDGSIEAIMQGATVRFRDFNKFVGALGANA